MIVLNEMFQIVIEEVEDVPPVDHSKLEIMFQNSSRKDELAEMFKFMNDK